MTRQRIQLPLKQKTVQTVRKPSVQRVRKVNSPTPIPKYEAGGQTKKIAIIQGGAWGDNINSTLMLKPIKDHFEHSIIDIHTSTLYASAFHNNPHINTVVVHHATNKNDAINLALSVPEKIADANYDIIFTPHPIFNHDKWSCINHQEWGENIVFAWVRALEDQGIPYGDRLVTTMKLTDEEITTANEFFEKLPKGRRNILMEIHGESGQTPWTHHWTMAVGKYLCETGCNIIISHKDDRGDIQTLRENHRGQVFWAGSLSIRECAQLFNKCDAFISVSSGLSNACNTDWCQESETKWFEVANSRTCSSAAIKDKNKNYWFSNDMNGFIELLKEKL